MTYKKEAPRRIAVLQKGLVENGHYGNSNTLHENLVNTPIKAQGKIIGYLQDHTFVKRVQGSKHMLRKPPAWCISKEAFCQEVMPQAEKIIVEDVESGRFYECRTEVFVEHAFEIQRGDFEPQLALTLNYWQKQGNGHRQLSLWGGEKKDD
jgi:hypothetical protein